MDKNPCSCGGENPNCYRCDGTGMVATRVLPIRSDGRVRPQISSQESTPTTITLPVFPKAIKPIIHKQYVCQKCNEIFTDPTYFIHHVRTFHPNLKTSKNKNHKKQKVTQQSAIPTTEKQIKDSEELAAANEALKLRYDLESENATNLYEKTKAVNEAKIIESKIKKDEGITPSVAVSYKHT
jgi:hypothetical protein